MNKVLGIYDVLEKVDNRAAETFTLKKQTFSGFWNEMLKKDNIECQVATENQEKNGNKYQ